MKAEKFEKKTFLDLIEELPKVSFNEVQSSVKPVIFDTNFLFVPFDFPVEIVSELRKVIGAEYSLYIYEGTLLELANIEKKKVKNKKYLPLIAKMLKVYGFKIIKSEQTYIDDQIIENASSKVIIATNDKELRKTLWKMH